METKVNKTFNFVQELTEALQKLTPEEFTEPNALLSTQNDKQKLKSIKKILESKEESNIKNVFNSFIGPLAIKEYIYGNLESKPSVLNIFKVLSISASTLIESIYSLENFDEVKKVLEIIEMLSISNRFPEEEKQKIIEQGFVNRIYDLLFKELESGSLLIIKNEFRTKWLESFYEILRSMNYVVRFVGQTNESFEKRNKEILKMTQDCVSCSLLFTKEVITQLFLLLVYLKPDLPIPECPLQQIHYLHALTIVKGEITLKPLLKLANELKDTEQKTQLTPILLKSFQEYFQVNKNSNHKNTVFDEELKQNAFDYAISLFDVGKSTYPYLEEIVDIIIVQGGSWSLEGNFTRKFFIAKVALKHVSTKIILDYWPSCLEDCFFESGNMTMPYVSDCTEAFLFKLYIELNKDYDKWMKEWIGTYKKLLLSENRTFIRGITEFINPILLKINSSNSLLLKDICSMPKEDSRTQLGIISLMKCYKDIGKIDSKHNVWLEQEQKIKEKEKANLKDKQIENEPITIENDETGVFIHLDDPQFEFDSQFLLDLLLSNDPITSLQTFEFLITSRKPSQLIHPQEMKLISEFYKNCLKTSIPEYRKSYLNLTRRMLERFRKNYEKDILLPKEETNFKKKQIKKETLYYQEFILFLNEIINLCFFNIYPDSIFEITNPALEILLLILHMFGPKGYEIRKGTFIEPCNLLEEKTNFFDMTNFENLVICLQSSYESIRNIADQIINNFVNFNEDGITRLRKIWKDAIDYTNKLSIKSYEFACRMVTFISQVKTNNKNIIEDIPLKYSFNELNICSYLLKLLTQRYEIFSHQFKEQTQIYYQNLIHGILTCFSYLFDQISQRNDLTHQNLSDIKLFLQELFPEIIKILNFSVEISSVNSITVVLDTIPSSQQTDKKVHTGTSIDNYEDSTTLINSLDNEDEGIENTLVVSFYLLTREAGLVFQSIGSLMGNKKIAMEVPKKELIELVNTYFNALINIKHLGSIDRISSGFLKMGKVLFHQEDQDLLKISEQLLLKLLQLLTDGKFTSILRRSAGVPYAFACLLKSEAVNRKILIEKTIKCLLSLSKESSETPIELRIHSLNILKKLFQDSDLKQELDIYVSEAFIISITGFTNQQWGVRNSSLMLFSVLANRTLGIKPTYNLLEFFHKCQGLLDFIAQELSLKRVESMYPPLYPIVLLLSRLQPFDLKEKASHSLKGITSKEVRKEELLSLLPLLRKAGDNHNYMGRVMTAKAILPFMSLLDIVPYCVELTETFTINATKPNFNNNGEHYRLTECYQLLTSYHEIVRTQEGLNYIFTLDNDTEQRLRKTLQCNAHLLSWTFESNISPTVQEIFTRIYHEFIQTYFLNQSNNNNQLLEEISKYLEELFNVLIKGKNNLGDLGHSLMYKSVIELISTCYCFFKQTTTSSSSKGESFIKYLQSYTGQTDIDYEMLSLVLEKTAQLLNEKETQSPLTSQLQVWLNQIDLVTIQSDEVIIQILSLMGVIGHTSDQETVEMLKVLKNIEGQSENKHMKVAIFHYLLSILSSPKPLQSSTKSEVQLFLKSLLYSYSNPSQLENLRECCIDYLQQSSFIESDLLIVYLRVLEDEEYDIRRKAAFHICRIMGTACRNEVVTARELIHRLLNGQSYVKAKNENLEEVKEMSDQEKIEFFKQLLEENSDFQIRQKNHSEERIFAYEKPNKYRTDINLLFEMGKLLPSSVLAKFGEEFKPKELEEEVEKYKEEIMSRDEYVFEYLVREMLKMKGKEEDQSRFEKILNNMQKLHPMLEGLSITNHKK